MRKYLVELFGSAMFMVLVGCVSITPAAGNLSLLALGLFYPVFMMLLAPVSGAYFNPAITLAAKLTGRLPAKEFVPYLVFQFLGAGVGVIIVKILKRGYSPTLFTPLTFPALLAEIIFVLVMVLLFLRFVANAPDNNRMSGGVMMGAFQMIALLTIANVSGGLLNPAASFGGVLLGMFPWNSLWIYLAADFLAAWVAADVSRRCLTDSSAS